MNAAHTPGPWTQYANGAQVYGGNGFFITCVQSANPINDARLIAAAPELLTALSKLRAEVSSLHLEAVRESLGNTNAEVLQLRVQQADAAIARATLPT